MNIKNVDMKEISKVLGYQKRAYAEIHMDRVRRNLERIRSIIPQKTQIMAIVKANAYGHDDLSIAQLLEEEGVNYFGVSNLHEGRRLRDHGIKGEILVLGYTSPECLESLLEWNIIPTVVSEEHARAFSQRALLNPENNGKKLKCHLAIDTGMGRLGVRCTEDSEIQEAVETVSSLYALPGIILDGLFTHYAAADSLNAGDIEYTRKQQRLFSELLNRLDSRGVEINHRHVSNSAGTVSYEGQGFTGTLARAGILLYGLMPSLDMYLPFTPEPVMDLKAEVSMVKEVPPGTFVSYGRHWKSESARRIATLTIGYADGLSRLLSGKGSVLFEGGKAPIIGSICMDQLMVDVTDIPGVATGDMGVVLGEAGGNSITADQLAHMYGSIGYEVVCGISRRIPRVILDGSIIKDVVCYL